MARPKGLTLPWLKSWCEANIRPICHEGEAKPKNIIQRLGDALPSATAKRADSRDYSGVWKALEGQVGINRAHWEAALRQLQSQRELSQLALEDFIERCNAEEEGRKPQGRRFVDCFASVRSRLLARLEAGKRPDKAVNKAFAEASGLIAAWSLGERWFLEEDIRAGIPDVVAMAQKWSALVTFRTNEEYAAASDGNKLEAHERAESRTSRVQAGLEEFLWRLALWLPRIMKWESSSQAEKRAGFEPAIRLLPEDLWEELHDPRNSLGSIFARSTETEGASK